MPIDLCQFTRPLMMIMSKVVVHRQQHPSIAASTQIMDLNPFAYKYPLLLENKPVSLFLPHTRLANNNMAVSADHFEGRTEMCPLRDRQWENWKFLSLLRPRQDSSFGL